ncbi:hypothetical protein CLV78_106160 [Aliiruegeria haliotis]|uniref:Uncharacterized protein n=1 Tax=Aliiruegeria haliotis TaxID=1280846 RepID=A0A2T0RN52_9RHOB|nr:hypothetical protein [Aliiruegeria haliotis]PRY22619.1 hypothetical protein CLV78_106160 [Aliiruegeria haliotis]
MFKRIATLATIFGMLATAPPAPAQSLRCAPRDHVVERLQTTFKETQLGLGLQTNTRLVEIWSSDATGTWTILLTEPNGMSCIMASGGNWHGGIARPDLADLGIPS